MDEKEFCKCVGSVIRELRINKGFYNLTLFSSKHNIPSSTLSRIEIGQNEPQLETLKKITDALGITLKDLFFEVEKNIQNKKPRVSEARNCR